MGWYVLAARLLLVGWSREDDVPAPARAHRGTTSLAACRPAGAGADGRLLAGCDGPDPSGSSQAARF